MKKIFLLTVFSLWAAAFCAAQSAEITEQNIPQQVSFAKPFDVRFALSYPPDTHVILDKESLPADFALSDEKTEISSPGNMTYHLTFLPFTLGHSTFTAVNFLVQNNRGDTLEKIVSQEAAIQVQPVKFFKDKELRDIRPPYIPSSWLWLVLILLGIGLFVAGILYFNRRRKQALLDPARQEDKRPADVIALSKINSLLQSGLWEKAQYKLFYIELGEILREYFWRRFQLDVSADTSTELLRRTRSVPALTPLYTELRDYLKSSDLVKFAKYIPDETTMQKDVGIVQKTVQQTAPPPPSAQKEDK